MPRSKAYEARGEPQGDEAGMGLAGAPSAAGYLGVDGSGERKGPAREMSGPGGSFPFPLHTCAPEGPGARTSTARPGVATGRWAPRRAWMDVGAKGHRRCGSLRGRRKRPAAVGIARA